MEVVPCQNRLGMAKKKHIAILYFVFLLQCSCDWKLRQGFDLLRDEVFENLSTTNGFLKALWPLSFKNKINKAIHIFVVVFLALEPYAF